MPKRAAFSIMAAAGAFMLLAACATPETRVRSALTGAGVKPPIAACMADRMVDRLSLMQLRRLGRLGKVKDAARDETLDQFLKRTKALQDPEILAVVSTSGAICWIRN